jgi:subtilisin-like proprotein convertase family protein
LVVLSSTDGDTVPEPGETVGLAIGVSTSGNTVAPGAVGTLATTTPGIAFLSASASYGTLAPGTTITNTSAPYVIRISPSFACGGLITFTHTINYQTGSQVATHTLRLNALAPLTQFSSPDVPKPIPATGTPIVNSFLTINQPGTIGRLTVNLNINHSFTGDMIMTLTNQTTGTNIRLYNRHGGGGQNLVGTTLDDYAPVSLIGSRAPFTGFFRPVQPLSAFNGQPISGTWKLTIADVLEDDGGTLNAWGLGFATEPFICEPVVVPSAAKIEAVVGTPQSTPVSTTFPTNLQAVVTGTDNFPLAGVVVTFTAPALPGSPGGTFTGGSTTNLTSSITVTTDANGRAIAPAFGANGITGTYTVTAQVSGVVTPANFVLTNLANCNPLIVTLATDDGSGNVCGTLSHALVNSSAGMTITLFTAGTGITVTGQLPPLAVGVNLDGGECGQTQTRFSIVGMQSGIGSGLVDGLRLSGNNLLRNLAIRGFSGRQIVALALIGGNGSGNQIRCTAAYK